jgi:hypothetical protein
MLQAASLREVIRLYGLRMWVEQSYKHVKHALGWSKSQVRSDKAIGRHWQLVWCAFSFCWYHVSHPSSHPMQEVLEWFEKDSPTDSTGPNEAMGTGENTRDQLTDRPQVSWPAPLRAVRGWLEPWMMLRRYWSGWSSQPPPPPLQLLLSCLERGQTISLYRAA